MVDPAPDIGRGVFILLKQGCIGPHSPTTQIVELVIIITYTVIITIILIFLWLPLHYTARNRIAILTNTPVGRD